MLGVRGSRQACHVHRRAGRVSLRRGHLSKDLKERMKLAQQTCEQKEFQQEKQPVQRPCGRVYQVCPRNNQEARVAEVEGMTRG